MPFNPHNISTIRAMMADPAELHSGQTRRQLVEHCVHQLVRFAHLARKGHKFRAAQFGLNLGRLQELLCSIGGREMWWSAFEPLLDAEDWPAVEAKAREYTKAFGLEQPSQEFIDRV